ncbi:hypothetical protein NL676_022409 [Syzygium grande]|nr:hypothetical protein NL676_022409 [Syzygium grande]
MPLRTSFDLFILWSLNWSFWCSVKWSPVSGVFAWHQPPTLQRSDGTTIRTTTIIAFGVIAIWLAIGGCQLKLLVLRPDVTTPLSKRQCP